MNKELVENLKHIASI